MMDALCAQFKNPALEVKNLHIQDEWGNRSSKIKKILQKKKLKHVGTGMKSFLLLYLPTKLRYDLPLSQPYFLWYMAWKSSCQSRQKFCHYGSWRKPSLKKQIGYGPNLISWVLLKKTEWLLCVMANVSKDGSLGPTIRKWSLRLARWFSEKKNSKFKTRRRP